MDIKKEVSALKRERIVAAAADLFYAQGYNNANLEAVAEVLGVTKPFIYSYFASKAELLKDICARGISSSMRALEEALALPGSPTERLAHFGRAFTTEVLQNQKFIAIFSREEKNLRSPDLDEINGMRREFDRKLTELLDLGVAAGDFTIADTRVTALAIGGMVSWAYVWYRPHGRLELNVVADRIAELILAMVNARQAPASR